MLHLFLPTCEQFSQQFLSIAGARHIAPVQDHCILDSQDLPEDAESSDEEAADKRRREAKGKQSSSVKQTPQKPTPVSPQQDYTHKDGNTRAIALLTAMSDEPRGRGGKTGAGLGEPAKSVPNPYADTIAALSNPFDGLVPKSGAAGEGKSETAPGPRAGESSKSGEALGLDIILTHDNWITVISELC